MKKKLSTLFPFSLLDLLKTFLILAAATLISILIRHLLGGGDSPASLLFVLAVLIVSRATTGYLFGILAAFAGVFLVNYVFTYPYFAFNFTISGYPITFFCMLTVSIMTCALTTQIKEQEKIRGEVAKEKMRANLLRAVSHDLRTPLTSIVGTTSALLDNDNRIPPEQQYELLREARDDAEWLIRMVENLLSITRINSQEAKIQKSDEVAEEIVGEAVRKFKKRFPEAEIAVEVPEQLLFVPMDPILIEQVLVNLLENAVLHGNRRDGIRVSVTRIGDSACFTVRDHGDGISAAAQAHLFESYPSADEGRESDSKRNMGIGLSVCLSIIKAHGGNMTAHNMAGGGAEFCFTLPMEEQHGI